MNNLLNRFYFLTKLSTSLFLLVLLLLLSYLFIKAYLNQNDFNKSTIKFEELSTQFFNLSSLVKQNSDNTSAVKGLVLENKKSVKKLLIAVNKSEKNLLNNDILVQIGQLSEENAKLKNQIDSLINELAPSKKLTSFNSTHSSKILESLINLIKHKLNDGSSFIEDVELLSDLKISEQQKSYVEKLLILSSKEFLGFNKLKNDFDHLSTDYLNQYYLSAYSKNLSKYFTNFISIEPNLNNNIQDEMVIILASAKKLLLEKKFNESVAKISLLDNGETFFSAWIDKAILYDEVDDILKNFIY